MKNNTTTTHSTPDAPYGEFIVFAWYSPCELRESDAGEYYLHESESAWYPCTDGPLSALQALKRSSEFFQLGIPSQIVRVPK